MRDVSRPPARSAIRSPRSSKSSAGSEPWQVIGQRLGRSKTIVKPGNTGAVARATRNNACNGVTEQAEHSHKHAGRLRTTRRSRYIKKLGCEVMREVCGLANAVAQVPLRYSRRPRQEQRRTLWLEDRRTLAQHIEAALPISAASAGVVIELPPPQKKCQADGTSPGTTGCVEVQGKRSVSNPDDKTIMQSARSTVSNCIS